MSRETIQISLGSTANAVTSHLLNLEGLEATANSGNAAITHAIYKESYVPRVLFVDEQVCSVNSPQQDRTVTTWKGEIQELQQEEPLYRRTEDLLQSASVLAYSNQSRYHVASQSTYTAASNGRHVQWDSDEEEEEEEDEGDRARRLRQQENRWRLETQQPLEEQMESYWKTADTASLSWWDYFMPPYPPNYNVVIPFSRESQVAQHWDTYQMGTTAKVTEELLERLRRILEACDAIQGVTILSQGCGIYAGMTTSLLQDLQEECRTAGRMVWNVVESENADASVDKENQTSTSWQAAQSERVRRDLQRGLALSDMTSHAHVVLPLVLPDASSLFASSARLALALEAATLPYRLSGSSPCSKVGLSGGYYGGVGQANEGYGVASNLSFGEYLACLQPSPQYPILELDTHVDGSTSWIQSLECGTSLERQRRLQQGGRDAQVQRPREVLPGEWLNPGDLLTTMSPQVGNANRTMHHHFALATSLRPAAAVTSLSTSQYLTLLMEGMAFRYRPEVAMGTVLNESISSLIANGYGAGSYWKGLLSTDSPVISVLGNTTRSYGYLNSIATNMKQVLTPRYRGYHNRDAAADVLPDAEDCQEALEHCFDLRDRYAPPEGSGLLVQEETYFESND